MLIRCLLLCFVAALCVPAESHGQATEARRMRRNANRTKMVYLNEYRQALPKFDAAVKQLESTLGDKSAKLARVGKEIQKQTDVFLRYVKYVNEDHPPFEPADLKEYSNTELGWETLTAAETLAGILPRVLEAENSVTVNLNLWKVLYLLEAELLRLKWMTSRLK